jgi:hypothetical protein
VLHPNDKRAYAIAALAVLVLIVQSFGLAWHAGAMPMPATLDQFGNPLCTTTDANGAPQEHGKVPNCCTMGCGSVAWQVDPSGDEPSYLIELPEQFTSNWPLADGCETRPSFRQNGPRAPPAGN